MGEDYSTAKNWRSRGAVPLSYLLKASRDTGRSLDWLIKGDENAVRYADPRGLAADVPGATHGMTWILREDSPNAWLAVKPPSEVMPPGVPPAGRGAHSNRGVPSVTDRALLPARDGESVRPLTLSLDFQGGTTMEYELIPRVCGGAAAGRERQAGGGATVSVDRAGEMAMSHEWLRRHLHHTTGDLATIQVIGDSMSPTLLDGDTIIIDRGVRDLQVDAIYVVHMLGRRLVKRVQRKFDGSVVIISDNAAYERETVPRDRVPEIEVLGRMVWPRVR